MSVLRGGGLGLLAGLLFLLATQGAAVGRMEPGLDASLRPVRTTPRRTLNPSGAVQVMATLTRCGEENSLCAAVSRCFEGIHRVPCGCDQRSLSPDKLTELMARLSPQGVDGEAPPPPERPLLLRASAAVAVRELFAACPLRRQQELSLLLDGRLAGVATVEEPMPHLLPGSDRAAGVGLLHRLSLRLHPEKSDAVRALLAEGRFDRLRLDNVSTGVGPLMVDQTEEELRTLEDEVLRALAKTDPSPLLQNVPLEDQRRVCQFLPVRESLKSSAWTLWVRVAHGTDCVLPRQGLFAALRRKGRGLKLLSTLPAGVDEDFGLYPFAEVVDLMGDGRPDVVLGPPSPHAPVSQGQGVLVNTGRWRWKFVLWEPESDR